MDRHRRMARTLGCLVASMTAGAAVLDWVQPDRPASQRRAIELVASGSTITQQWDSIRIDSFRNDSKKLSETHFFVDRQGNWQPTDCWVNQRKLGRASEVRIGLQSSAGSNIVTPSQVATTQELVSALQRACKIQARALWNDTIALPPAPSPQAERPTPVSTRLRQR